MRIISAIKVRAVVIALFAFYIVPVLPLAVLTSAPNFFGMPEPVGERIPLWRSAGSLLLLWFWALAPVGSGYFSAKLAQQQPLLHGLATGVVGAVLILLWVRGHWLFELAFALLVVSCGLFGGWLWRYRNRKRDVEL